MNCDDPNIEEYLNKNENLCKKCRGEGYRWSVTDGCQCSKRKIISKNHNCETKCLGPGHMFNETDYSCYCDTAKHLTVLSENQRTCASCPEFTKLNISLGKCEACSGLGVTFINGKCGCDIEKYSTILDTDGRTCVKCPEGTLLDKSSVRCVPCSGPGAELIETQGQQICTCDPNKANATLVGDECIPCPVGDSAVRIFPSTGTIIERRTPNYRCLSCHGPSATVINGTCHCSAPYILRDSKCIPCSSDSIYSNIKGRDGNCILCSGPGAHINHKGKCSCQYGTTLINSNKCSPCTQGQI